MFTGSLVLRFKKEERGRKSYFLIFVVAVVVVFTVVGAHCMISTFVNKEQIFIILLTIKSICCVYDITAFLASPSTNYFMI